MSETALLLKAIVAAILSPSVAVLSAAAAQPGSVHAASSNEAVNGAAMPALRRVLIPQTQVGQVLEQGRQRALVTLPREQFENLVRHAAKKEMQLPPRLLATRYRAALEGTALVGTGEWILANSEEGVLPLQPLNLALKRLCLDSTEAIVGELNETFGLFVERPGKHVVSFDWTARGDAGPGSLRFDLRLPDCALTSLELDLPVNSTPSVRQEACFLSGPLLGSVPTRRRWRLTCSGGVDLVITRVSGSKQASPLLLATLQTAQTFAPGSVQISFDFDLQVAHGNVREITCECDSSLQPAMVTARSADVRGWDVQGGTTKGLPSLLRIRLGEAVEERSIHLIVHCVTAAKPGGRVECPGMRLVGAVCLGETLMLRIPPEFQVEQWYPGDFRLVRVNLEATGNQTVTLRCEPARGSSWPNAETATALQRPHAQIVSRHPEVRVEQRGWWQVNSERSLLTSQLSYEVLAGKLFHLSLLVPAAWQVDRVDMSPDGFLRDWTATCLAGGVTALVINLERPAERLTPIRLDLQLHSGIPRAFTSTTGAERRIDFPALVPQHVRDWHGDLAIKLDSSCTATVDTVLPGAIRKSGEQPDRGESNNGPHTPLPVQPPWKAGEEDFFYSYRGEAVAGTLRIRPRQPRVAAHCSTDIIVTAERVGISTRLRLDPVVGRPRAVDIYLSAAPPGSWKWKCQEAGYWVLRTEPLVATTFCGRLAGVGAGNVIAAVALAALPCQQGSLLRLHLNQPLQHPITLETSFDLARNPPASTSSTSVAVLSSATAVEAINLAAGLQALVRAAHFARWDVPLLSLPGAESMEGQANLHIADAGLPHIDSTGLQEVVVEPKHGSPEPWRSFSYSNLPISLRLLKEGPIFEQSATAVADQCQLTTFLRSNDRLLHYYRFRISNWNQHMLPVRLPANASIVAVKLAGAWVSQVDCQQTAGDAPLVKLPVNSANEAQIIELLYTTPNVNWFLWLALTTPRPLLPVETLAFHRTWSLPGTISPLSDMDVVAAPRSERSSGTWTPISQLDWIRHGRDRTVAASYFTGNNASTLAMFGIDRANLCEFEPVAGSMREETVLVVRADRLSALGCLLGGIFIALFFGGAYSARTRLIFLAFWLIATGLAIIWLPSGLRGLAWWPAAIGAVFASAWYLRWSLRSRPVKIAAALMAMSLVPPLPSHAAAPEIETVWILPGSEGGTKQSVLLSSKLLKLLQQLAQGRGHIRQSAVITCARYVGAVANQTANFECDLNVYSFSDGSATVELPFDRIALEQASVDGKPAYPLAHVPPQPGFTLMVDGNGFHRVRLRFTVNVSGTPENRELQFSVPELPQNQLSLNIPAGALHAHAVSARGGQRVTTVNDRLNLQAALGRVNAVRVQWYQTNPVAPKWEAEAKEFHLWDFEPSSPVLRSLFQYHVHHGVLSRLLITLPNRTVVRHVEAMPLPGSRSSAPRLSDWSVTTASNGQHVQLDFQIPIIDSVQVLLELVRIDRVGSDDPLSLPATDGAAPSDGILAYRTGGKECALTEYQGVRGIQPALFTALWRAALNEDPGTPATAFTFRRTGGVVPLLRLKLSEDRTQARCGEEVVWTLEPQGAEVTVHATLSSPRADLSLLEWRVPSSVIVNTVTGPHVQSWSRNGSALQVWLKKSVPRTEVKLAGFMGGQAKSDTSFSLPCIQCASTGTEIAYVRVIAGDGMSVQSETEQNLVSLPDSGSPLRVLAYLSSGGPYGAQLRATANQAPANVCALAIVRAQGRGLQFATTFDYQFPSGKPAEVILSAPEAVSKNIQIQGEHILKRFDEQSSGRHIWRLKLEPGIQSHYQVTLKGTVFAGADEELSVPDLRAERVGHSQRWLAIPERDIEISDLNELQRERNYTPLLHLFPGIAQKLQAAELKVWKAPSGAAQPRLRLNPAAWSDMPIRILFDEQAAAAVDHNRWLHKAEYRLYQPRASKLVVVLPTSSILVRISLDGEPVAPLHVDARRIWLRLKGGSGLHRLALTWTLANADPMAQPSLDKPHIEQAVYAPSVTTHWRVLVPPGYQIVKHGAVEFSPSTSEADVPGGEDHEEPVAWSSAQGTPIYWTTETPLETPNLRLYPVTLQATRKAMVWTAPLIALLALLTVAYRRPGIVYWFERLLPEQLMLVGCIGCFFDLRIIWGVMVVSGAFSRILVLTTWLFRPFSSRPQSHALAEAP
jgi:hypothetical protein